MTYTKETMKPLTVVIDLSVALHQLNNGLEKTDYKVIHKDQDHYHGYLKAQMVWLMSCRWLGELYRENLNVILAADSKPYWRSEYLTRPEVCEGIPRKLKKDRGTPVAYKAGRKLPTYQFSKLKDQIQHQIVPGQPSWQMLRVPGYEADDIAASVVHINRQLGCPQDILLVTVDTDWLGLVSEEVGWFCMFGYHPRHRQGLAGVNEWANRRLGITFDDPRELWDYKSTYGDKSDNLPAGSPLEVIDLLQPPSEFTLWNKPGYHSIVSTLLSQGCKPELPDVQKAVGYIYQLKRQPFIQYYQLTTEVA